MSAIHHTAKHTPGPWKLEPAKEGGRVLACDDRATIIHEPPCSPFNEEARADARLIAAAPELLDVLQQLLTRDWHRGTLLLDAEDFVLIDSLVAKATYLLIDTEQSEEQQAITLFHEALHMLGLKDEEQVEAMARKLAGACPEALTAVKEATNG